MAAEDHYRVGSTTKTFTAVVVLQLVAEGRLALDDLVASRLPGRAVANGDVLTVEHLLRMRSGLFDFEDGPSLLGHLDAHLAPYSLGEVLDLGLRGPASFRPGPQRTTCRCLSRSSAGTTTRAPAGANAAGCSSAGATAR